MPHRFEHAYLLRWVDFGNEVHYFAKKGMPKKYEAESDPNISGFLTFKPNS